MQRIKTNNKRRKKIMANKQGRQCIDCTVSECEYNQDGSRCRLDGITVNRCCTDCECAEDSMCASFKRK